MRGQAWRGSVEFVITPTTVWTEVALLALLRTNLAPHRISKLMLKRAAEQVYDQYGFSSEAFDWGDFNMDQPTDAERDAMDRVLSRLFQMEVAS